MSRYGSAYAMTRNSIFDSVSSVSNEDKNFVGNNLNVSNLYRLKKFDDGDRCKVFGNGIRNLPRNRETKLTADLMLEPIVLNNKKCTRSVELKRALGITFGSISGKKNSGATNSKPIHPVLKEDLKQVNGSVLGPCFNSKGRANRLDDSHKLNKHCEVPSPKKQHRSETQTNERSVRSNSILKNVVIHRNTADIATQTLKDRTKNTVSDKRPHTLVAETRGDGQINSFQNQPSVTGKDKNAPKNGAIGSNLVEETLCKLPSGEGWDKKAKRKRSAIVSKIRSMDRDGELKRSMSNKFKSQHVLKSCDPHNLRLNVSPRSNIHEDNHAVNPVTEGNASRALRAGPALIVKSSSTLEVCERPQIVNNYKRPMSTRSKAPSITEWGGQRPPKLSRTKRPNLVSTASNQGKLQGLSKTCPFINFDTSGSPRGKRMDKTKPEDALLPARFYKSEEYRAGHDQPMENRLVTKEIESEIVNPFQNKSLSGLPAKNKEYVKDEIGSGVIGVRRQGRSASSSTFSVEEKLKNPVPINPFRPKKPSFDKNGSKLGRPLRKLCKAFAPTSKHLLNSGSPNFTGELDNDYEELLTSAKFASNASYNACSGSFWKKMEPIFASTSLDDISYLKQQGEIAYEENFLSQNMSKEPTTYDMVQLHDLDSLYGNSVSPLYQRVLSSLIIEEGNDIFEDTNGKVNIPSQSTRNDFHGECLHVDVEPGKMDAPKFNYKHMCHPEQKKQCTVNKISCNESIGLNMGSRTYNPLHNDALLHGGLEVIHSDTRMLPEYSLNDQNGDAAVFETSSNDSQYEQMYLDDKVLLELQSIGIYPETLPNLMDGDAERIDVEIIKLQKELCQEGGEKKSRLDKIYKVIQDEKKVEEQEIEQVAMDRLVLMAYRKHSAARANSASKCGNRITRQSSLACVKRTLGKCRKFEDTNTSCFNDPILRNALFAPPHRGGSDADSLNCFDSPVATNKHPESHQESKASGSLPSGVQNKNGLTDESDQDLSMSNKEKNEILEKVCTTVAFGNTSILGNIRAGGAAGKRSERDKDRNNLIKNPISKSGLPSLSILSGDRKAELKHKQQKTISSRTSENEDSGSFTKSANTVCLATCDGPSELTNNKDPTSLTNLNVLELGMDVVGGDLEALLNFEVDDLQEDYFSMGLEIPMDDLSDLKMVL